MRERESMLRDKSIVIEQGERSIVIGKMVLCNRGVCVFNSLQHEYANNCSNMEAMVISFGSTIVANY